MHIDTFSKQQSRHRTNYHKLADWHSHRITNQHVRVVEVVSPVGSDLALAADVPDVQLEAVRQHRLDVEALRGRDLGDVLGSQRLQQRRLASVIESEQQQTDLALLSGPQLPQ